jgi:hypothetical protein
MKKLYLFTIIAAMFAFSQTYGQMAIFSDNFDSYAAGVQLVCQNAPGWTTWDNLPCDPTEDPYVSTDYAYSGANSVNIVSITASSGNDLVHVIDNYTTGKYDVSFWMYIPTGYDGYFNVLQDFAAASSQWGMQVYFYAGGTANMDAGGALVQPFNFTPDTWMHCEVVVDLDNDLGEFWLDGTLLHSWVWSSGAFGTGTLDQLGGVDLYGNDDASTPEPCLFYFDDFEVIDLLYVPVELTSFTASTNNIGQVVLNWQTATETNNRMFEIQRKTDNSNYSTIGFVDGAGTSTEQHNYTYVDKNVNTGNYTYRLKQIDFDGRFQYSDEVNVSATGPTTFNLAQNYPNPFNPTTNISFSVPESGNVKLAVYNTIGQEVAVLVNGAVTVGQHEVTFNAASLPSGTYFYKLQTSNSIMVKKMMLLK